MLRIAIQSDVKTLNPLLNSNTTDGFIAFLMFEPLLTADDKGQSGSDARDESSDSTENGGISKRRTDHHVPSAQRREVDRRRTGDVERRQMVVASDHEPNNNIVSRHGYDYVARA